MKPTRTRSLAPRTRKRLSAALAPATVIALVNCRRVKELRGWLAIGYDIATSKHGAQACYLANSFGAHPNFGHLQSNADFQSAVSQTCSLQGVENLRPCGIS